MAKYSLKDIVLFENCDQNFLRKLETHAHKRRHNKGKVLFFHGDEARSFFVITSGWVKLYRETTEGEQAIINVLPEKHILGETAIFNSNNYPYSAEIIKAAEIVSYPLAELKNEIQTNNNLAMAMLNSMAEYRRRLDREIEHRTLQNAAQRIGCFILRMAQQDDKTPTEVHIPYDKTIVAAHLGMKPETFSRALTKLKTKTGIKVTGSTIELNNLEQLSHYCCTVCSSTFPCENSNITK